MSYANTILYSSVLPSYESSKEKSSFSEKTDANNPNLFKDEGNVIVKKR